MPDPQQASHHDAGQTFARSRARIVRNAESRADSATRRVTSLMHLRRHIPLGWAIPLALLTPGTVILVGLILAGVFASARALSIGMPIYYVLCLAAGVITLGAGLHRRQPGWT